ncbi:hypothetical protein ACN28S_56845 [Cystobacter fuscus]
MRFLGWDLSDPFARRPRAVDVAVVDLHGRVDFEQREWPAPDGEGRLDPEALVAAFPVGPADVVVVDGPQALARPGERVREAERLEAEGLRFPGAGLPTHDELDAALCAWLGWLTRTAPERVHAVGLPLWRDAEGWLREGRILDIRRT